jgi:hypothetical protein
MPPAAAPMRAARPRFIPPSVSTRTMSLGTMEYDRLGTLRFSRISTASAASR